VVANHLLDQQIPWAGTCAAEVQCGPSSDPAVRLLQTSGGPDGRMLVSAGVAADDFLSRFLASELLWSRDLSYIVDSVTRSS
jgi:hypothetical protein